LAEIDGFVEGYVFPRALDTSDITASDRRMRSDVGVLGAALYLPPEIRRNDYWPQDIVDGWMAARKPPVLPEQRSEGLSLVLAAMAKQARDPFHDAVERRVMPAGMTLVDMQEHAARDAIGRAGIDPQQIDLVLTNTVTPDFLHGNPACTLHLRLGLAKACFSMETEAATSSFQMQLMIASAMISTGQARYALLVQSSAASRHMEREDPISPLFGDGATGVVVGPVSDGRGLLGAVQFTDGRFPRTLIGAVRGGTWFDEGRGVIHQGDPHQQDEVFLLIADICKESITAALDRAGQNPSAVDFFCMHQGTPWLRRVVQEYVGLDRARSYDLYATTGHLMASNIPATLARAHEAGELRAGDLVVLMGGGQGMTYGASVLRWGA
jgi:3-oxoacyl-[acyl-carrier-protein] synthase-3